MTATLQPSTVRNLEALAGDGRQALAYGSDILDLIGGGDWITIAEGDLFVAAVGAALVIAPREARDYGTFFALDAAARRAVDSIAAVRNWDRSHTPDRLLLEQEVRRAMIFQLTDLDEQD